MAKRTARAVAGAAMVCCCLVARALAARPLAAGVGVDGPFDDPFDGPFDDDPFDGALPPHVRVAVEYLMYYFSTACAPGARDEDFFAPRL